MRTRVWIGSLSLLLAAVATTGALAAWKQSSLAEAAAAAALQPEPVESVAAAEATPRDHYPTTTSIGTVVALRSITLRNELAGTVREVRLEPGKVVGAGSLLVALDVSVEEAELAAQEAQAALAESVLARARRLREDNAVSEEEMERARADRDVARARIAGTRAVIERKTLRAPFRARVGLADVHPGQYLDEGTRITTLQGVDGAVHVDFAVEQQVAARLRPGDRVRVHTADRAEAAAEARIVAVDARVDPATRNATVRARIEGADPAPAPGASVRVRVPVGAPRTAVAVPTSALRKGPAGDHVFVLEADQEGHLRARHRAVEVAALAGDEALITAGLEAGERVAAAGSFKLREAALVAVAEAPRGDAAGGR